MNPWSQPLLIGALVVLLIGLALPGWDTARTPKRAVKRRIYWSATILGIIALVLAGSPDIQSSIAFAAAALILMIGWAYFRTPNIKINGQIWAAYPPNREPDPAAPGDRQ
jgi:uncharacterized membrane protein